jgi:uncharacterized membrane protein
MRRFSNVVWSRVGLILGGAIATMLVLPMAAFAGGFAGHLGAHHRAVGDGGSADLAIFLGIVAAAVLSALIFSRIDARREGSRRAASGIERTPVGAGS